MLLQPDYNNKDKHNADPYPDICQGNPSNFSGPIDWLQSAKTLNTVVKEYKYCCKNWRVSGNQGPFRHFIKNNNLLLWVRQFVNQYSELFAKTSGELPIKVFNKSIASTNNENPKSCCRHHHWHCLQRRRSIRSLQSGTN